MQQGPQGYPQQQPQKKGMPTWLIVLLVIGLLGLTGVAGCLVCVGAGAKAVSDSIASASARKETVKVKIEELLGD